MRQDFSAFSSKRIARSRSSSFHRLTTGHSLIYEKRQVPSSAEHIFRVESERREFKSRLVRNARNVLTEGRVPLRAGARERLLRLLLGRSQRVVVLLPTGFTSFTLSSIL